MKRLSIIFAAVAFVLLAAMPAAAQFKIGPRVGMNVNSLHFNKEVFNDDNRAGFTGGLMTEFTVPLVGIGLDASVMYVRRDAKWMEENTTINAKRDYIAIPVNLKYKLNVPAINHIVRPFLTTGPEFAFLTSGKAINQAFRNKKTDISWNFGLGVELISHLQIAASYGIGLNKAVEAVSGATTVGIEGKNRYWTVTAAWLF
ncbi:MAG: porin family protein [Clostridium sp.]|nr:porin family protein [Clostridium sp.]